MMVYAYEGCTIDHVRGRFFPGRDNGSRSASYRRIAFLAEQNYLERVRVPSLTGIGSGKALLKVGPAARPVLAKVLELPSVKLIRVRRDSPVVLPHHLALCDIRTSFEIGCERSAFFVLEEWITERELRSTKALSYKSDEGDARFVPDAVFTLKLGDGRTQQFCLEMDMGTMSSKRLRQKLRAYLLSSLGIPVMFVALERARQASILQLTLAEAIATGSDSTMVWVAQKSALTPEAILDECVWAVAGGPITSIRQLAGLSQPKQTVSVGSLVFRRKGQ